MGGQAIRGRAARLVRAIRAVRKLAVKTGYVTAADREPEAGAGHPYRQGSGTWQPRPVATTVLAWNGRLGDAVDASPPGEAVARPQVVTEMIYETDPVLRRLHRENVEAAPEHWLRLTREVL